MLHFDDVYRLVAGVSVNKQWFFELRRPSDWRPAAVFLIVLRSRFTSMLGDGLGHRFQVFPAFQQVRYRLSGVSASVCLRVEKYVEQGDHAPVTPAHQADTRRIDERVALNHPLPGTEDIVVLFAAIIGRLGVSWPIAGAAPVFRRTHHVTLLHQFSSDGGAIRRTRGHVVAVYTAVDQD